MEVSEQETETTPDLVRVVVRMPVGMVAELDAAARRKDVGKRSQVVRQAVRQFLDAGTARPEAGVR